MLVTRYNGTIDGKYFPSMMAPSTSDKKQNLFLRAWVYFTVVSERKLINVCLIEFNDEFKHAIKGKSQISTLRAIIARKILDNLRV